MFSTSARHALTPTSGKAAASSRFSVFGLCAMLSLSAKVNYVSLCEYQKKNRPAVNDPTDHKSSQYAKIKEDISSASSKISVTDFERENRLSKVISLYSKSLNQEEIAK